MRKLLSEQPLRFSTFDSFSTTSREESYAKLAKVSSWDSATGMEVDATVGGTAELSEAVGKAHACVNKAPKVRTEIATMVAN